MSKRCVCLWLKKGCRLSSTQLQSSPKLTFALKAALKSNTFSNPLEFCCLGTLLVFEGVHKIEGSLTTVS